MRTLLKCQARLKHALEPDTVFRRAVLSCYPAPPAVTPRSTSECRIAREPAPCAGLPGKRLAQASRCRPEGSEGERPLRRTKGTINASYSCGSANQFARALRLVKCGAGRVDGRQARARCG